MDKILIPRNVLDKVRLKKKKEETNKNKPKTKVPPGVTITQSTVGYFYIQLERNARISHYKQISTVSQACHGLFYLNG